MKKTLNHQGEIPLAYAADTPMYSSFKKSNSHSRCTFLVYEVNNKFCAPEWLKQFIKGAMVNFSMK